MRVLFVLTLLTGLCAAQFGYFGFERSASNLFSSASKLADTTIKQTRRIVKHVPVIEKVLNFDDFVAKTGKTYSNKTSERAKRKAIFEMRQKIVGEINEEFKLGKSLFIAEINAFADLTLEEYDKQLKGNKKSVQGDIKAKVHREIMSRSASHNNNPSEYDWREHGAVTPVKYQGTCGSCWSFAVTGAIEGHFFHKTGKLANLSEQNLVDCGTKEYGLNGCNGGFQEYGFEFVIHQDGIASREKYPNIHKRNPCAFKNDLKEQSIKVSGFMSIPPGDEEAMEDILTRLGPLACSVNSIETLLLYKSGIFSDERCNHGEVNHSVLVVGYGSESGHNYWIIKNSWDTAWGEAGYFRLPRGKNFCGIAKECSYPVI